MPCQQGLAGSCDKHQNRGETDIQRQPTYAAQYGISTRTLRDWVRRFGAGRRPHARLRAAIVASIEQLQNVLAALDAESAAGSAAAHGGGQEVEERQVEQHADSARQMIPAGDDRNVAGPELTAVQQVAVVVPAAAPCRSAACSAEQDRSPSYQEATLGVVDLEALRKRAAQLRAAHAASGAPRRKSFFDWDAE